jgi:hypothetical protein
MPTFAPGQRSNQLSISAGSAMRCCSSLQDTNGRLPAGSIGSTDQPRAA